MTSLNTKGGGHNYVPIEQDEPRWCFSYEVSSENADPIHFALEIFVESNEVKVSMVNPQGARKRAKASRIMARSNSAKTPII